MSISDKNADDSVDYKQLSSYDDNLKLRHRNTTSDSISTGKISPDSGDEDESKDEKFPDSTTNSDDTMSYDYASEQQVDDGATEHNYGNDDSQVLISPSVDFFDDDDYDDEDYGDDGDEKDVTAVKEDNSKSASESQLEAGDQQHRSYSSDEGSGGSIYNKFRSSLYNNRFRLDFLDKYKTKHQKSGQDKVVGDDDDDDDEDSGVRMVGRERDDEDTEGSGKFINDDDDDDDEDDSFFSSKRKTGSKYFRKNANDAIKIISTPNGKVGIVYQQTDDTKERTASTSTNRHSVLPSVIASSNHDRKTPVQKITPVLTPDGKVALLYRGASENTKYEPILNLTHTFNFDNKSSNVNSIKEEFDESDEELETVVPVTIPPAEELTTTASPPSASSPSKEFENSILPSINRPLSEVLGIKKNQFKQFRIKDTPTFPPPTSDPNIALATTVDLSKYPGAGAGQDFNYGFDMSEYDDRNLRNNDLSLPQSSDIRMSDSSLMEPTKTTAELISKSEVVNLAIIPHFDEEFERQQRQFHEAESRKLHHRQRHRHRHLNQDLSNIHCIMQAMMGVAAVSTVFGMLGAIFKQRILDQIRLMHW